MDRKEKTLNAPIWVTLFWFCKVQSDSAQYID